MKSKILTVINQKGGVGKSTITTNLSYGLYLKNKKVLIIDLDPQGNSSSIFCTDIDSNNTISLAFIDKKIRIKSIIKPAIVDGIELSTLHIIASDIKLASISETISSRLYRERILKGHLSSLENDYDFIIIDCPPTLGVLAINAIFSANIIIIPTNYGKYSLDGMADLLTAIQEIKENQPYEFYILRNLYEQKNSITNKYIEQELQVMKDKLLTTIIRKNEAINKSQIFSQPIQIFNNTSKGNYDFSLLVEEVILRTETVYA